MSWKPSYQISEQAQLHSLFLFSAPDRRYVALTDALVSCEESYIEGFETPASELLKKRKDVSAAVVATTDAQSLRSREGWSPAYIVMHFFKDADGFATFQTSGIVTTQSYTEK